MNGRSVVVNRERCDEASIDEYARDILEIWPKDKERPVLLQWLGVVKHASILAEEVRKSAWDRVAYQLAEVFVWWLNFINRINIMPPAAGRSDLILTDSVFYLNCRPSDIVWYKFPKVCPTCFGYLLSQGKEISSTMKIEDHLLIEAYESLMDTPSCQCLARKRWMENRSEGFKEFVKNHIRRIAELKKKEKPGSLKNLEKSLNRIFEPSIDVLSADEITFHLLEEIGEVTEALVDLHLQPTTDEANFLDERKRRLKNLRDELADVFSWVTAIRAKTCSILKCASDFAKERIREEYLRDIVEKTLTPTESIVGLVWEIYGKGYNELRCEVCEKEVCDPYHPNHKTNSGQLFGKAVDKYFQQIRSLSISEEG